MEKDRLILEHNSKIIELKARLKATDYKAIKYAEGEITAQDYAETLGKRRAWRAEINALETKIEALKKV